VALDDFRQVGPDVIEIDLPFRGRLAAVHLGLVDERQRMALEHGVALADGEPTHHPAHCGRDDVLHLHGFHDQQRLADVHRIPFADFETDYRPLQGSRDGPRTVRSRHGCGRCGCGRSGRGNRGDVGLPMLQHGQRIDLIDFGAGQPERLA